MATTLSVHTATPCDRDACIDDPNAQKLATSRPHHKRPSLDTRDAPNQLRCSPAVGSGPRRTKPTTPFDFSRSPEKQKERKERGAFVRGQARDVLTSRRVARSGRACIDVFPFTSSDIFTGAAHVLLVRSMVATTPARPCCYIESVVSSVLLVVAPAMALDARSLPAVSVPISDLQNVGTARPWTRKNGGGDASETKTTAAVAVDVPAALWSDEGRMKRELVAWARAKHGPEWLNGHWPRGGGASTGNEARELRPPPERRPLLMLSAQIRGPTRGHYDDTTNDRELPSPSRVPLTLERKSRGYRSPSSGRLRRARDHWLRSRDDWPYDTFIPRHDGLPLRSKRGVTTPRHRPTPRRRHRSNPLATVALLKTLPGYCANYFTTLSVPGTPQTSRKDPRRTTGRARRHPHPRVGMAMVEPAPVRRALAPASGVLQSRRTPPVLPSPRVVLLAQSCYTAPRRRLPLLLTRPPPPPSPCGAAALMALLSGTNEDGRRGTSDADTDRAPLEPREKGKDGPQVDPQAGALRAQVEACDKSTPREACSSGNNEEPRSLSSVSDLTDPTCTPHLPVNPMGMGLGQILNPSRVMGFLTGMSHPCEHGPGMAKPSGFVPVAIPTPDHQQVNDGDVHAVSRSLKARFSLAYASRNVSTTNTHGRGSPCNGGGRDDDDDDRSTHTQRQESTRTLSLLTRYWHSAQSPTQGLGSFSPSPTLLVLPYYEQHETRCYAPLLDVRPRGRNQDKPLRPKLFTQTHHRSEWLAAQSLGPALRNFRFTIPDGIKQSVPSGIRDLATGNDYLMRIISRGPSNRPEAPQLPAAAPQWRRRPGPRTRRAHAARRVADTNNTPPARDGGAPQWAPRAEAMPFLPAAVDGQRAAPPSPNLYGLRNNAVVYASSVSTNISHHLASVRYLIASTPNDFYPESKEEYALGQEFPGWDYSGLCDPEAFLTFQAAADYFFGYSDIEYDPTRECFAVDAERGSDGHTTNDDDGVDPMGAQPPDLQDRSPQGDEPRSHHQAQDAHELDDGDEQTCHPHVERLARARILTDGGNNDPFTLPRASQKLITAVALLRAMPQPTTPEGRKLHREAQALPRAQPPVYATPRFRGVSIGGVLSNQRRTGEPRTPTTETRTPRIPVRSRLQDTRSALDDGDARNFLNQRRQQEEAAARQPRHNDQRHDDRDGDRTPEPARTRMFSRSFRMALIPLWFRQPTTITKYSGETDPRVWLNDYRLACQLGRATDDTMIIRNLPFHLADSTRMWLEHLPLNRIHDWNDLVETFVGNFQGTYVRPENTWDLRGCNQKPGESLRNFIWRFSKRYTELPNIIDTQIIHSFFESTTSYNLICKLGRNPPFPTLQIRFGGGGGQRHLQRQEGKAPRGDVRGGQQAKDPLEEVKSRRATMTNEVPTVDPNHKGPQDPPCGGGVSDADGYPKDPPTEILANAWNIQQLMRVGPTLARTIPPSDTASLSLLDPKSATAGKHESRNGLLPPKGYDIAKSPVVPAAVIFVQEEDALPPSGQSYGHFAQATRACFPHVGHDSYVCHHYPRGAGHVEGTLEASPLEGRKSPVVRHPRSTESRALDGWTKVPRSRDPTRGSIEPSTSIERGRPTLIEQGMDIRSNYPLPTHPSIHGSISIVGSTGRLLLSPSKGTPRNEEKIGTSRAKRGSGVLTIASGATPRGCAKPAKGEGESKDPSTNASLRRIASFSRRGSGATRGHIDERVEPSSAAQQEAHYDDTPDDRELPSRSRVPLTLERKCPSRLPLTLERASPSRSRPLAALEGRRTGNSARGPAMHSFHDMMARLCGQKEESLHHATALRRGKDIGQIRSPQPGYRANYFMTLSVPGTPQASRKDPRRTTGRARRHPHPRVISLEATPEFEDAIPARIVHDVGSTVHLATSAPRTHMYDLPHPWSIKGEGEPMQRRRARRQRRQDLLTRYWHSAQSPTQGLGGFSPSPTLLVLPYYEQHETRCYAPLLDVRPRGRNQDKTLRPEFNPRNPPSERVADSAITC
ncbi:hypothetical protein HU200_027450 [Digitaria exilis]|uniref:Retrotransposon gag domain-containing protein n=1 Tax=Digitaria exilis TaxID=1010633 RepID=A0A835BXK8_9POAL|nr:hypothetical protein HU200_027450 [Digitaria exilis]